MGLGPSYERCGTRSSSETCKLLRKRLGAVLILSSQRLLGGRTCFLGHPIKFRFLCNSTQCVLLQLNTKKLPQTPFMGRVWPQRVKVIRLVQGYRADQKQRTPRTLQ